MQLAEDCQIAILLSEFLFIIAACLLKVRGCGLQGLRATPTLNAHKNRFTSNGWSRAHAWDMDTIYRKFLDKREQARYSYYPAEEDWHMFLKLRIVPIIVHVLFCQMKSEITNFLSVFRLFINAVTAVVFPCRIGGPLTRFIVM